MKASTIGLGLLGCSCLMVMMGCGNPMQGGQYGTTNCDEFYGGGATRCQEYRQRKADADMQSEASQIVKAYRQCLEKYQDQPDKQKENCAVYTQTLHVIELNSPSK